MQRKTFGPLGWLAVVVCPVLGLAQTPTPPAPVPAPVPKVSGHWGEDAVGFRWIEEDSRDNRWNAMDTGPFLCSALRTPSGMVRKSLAVRIGPQRQAAVCYDLEKLSMPCGWTGNFLAYNPARFGIISPPVIAGPLRLTAPAGPGWPNREVIYRGLHLHGPRVVLSYTVGGVAVRESPWLETARLETGGEQMVFTRTLEIGPSEQPLTAVLADWGTQVVLRSDSDHAALVRENEAPVRLRIAPRAGTIRVKLLIRPAPVPFPGGQSNAANTPGDGSAKSGDWRDSAAVTGSPAPPALTPLTRPGPGRWGPALATRGTLGRAAAPYVVDTITLPFENPFGALLFVSGHDFFSQPGRGAICTLHGDVWLVEGLDADLDEVRWQRFATGLFQPLGLKIVEDQVYVLGRDRLTRLHDLNGDGEADYYESFNHGAKTSAGGHDFSTCLETDAAGNFYYVSEQGVHRITADGGSYRTIATGLRNPNGMGIGPGDVIVAAPQEGNWTPASAVFEITEGGYYGYGGPRESERRPLGYDPPICWIPRRIDNSTGGQVWVTSDRWGPLAGQLLNLSFGQCRLLLTLSEPRRYRLPESWPVLGGSHRVEVSSPVHPPSARILQGGSLELPLAFDSGVIRGRFSPHDGQLYVSGLRGWVSAAVRDGCLQRVRYTGRPVHLPLRVRTLRNGIALSFTEPLDAETAEDPGSYDVEQWNYRYSADYGSAEYRVSDPDAEGRDAVDVLSASLLDPRTVFLELARVQPVMQLAIQFAVRAEDGTSIRHHYYHTVHAVPDAAIDPARLTRRPNRSRPAEPADEELARGLRWKFTQLAGDAPRTDRRRSRLAVLDVPAGEPPTPFLVPGEFQARAEGFVRVPLRGSYTFSLEGRGEVRLRINDREVLAGRGEDLRTLFRRTVALRKGLNRLELDYVSPSAGDARLRLLWSGEEFDVEPLPPTQLFHTDPDQLLGHHDQVRRGRALFASLRCHRCHAVPAPDAPTGSARTMPELEFDAPDLSAAGEWLRPDWVARWLLEPHRVRDQVSMPRFFPRDPRSDCREVADLTAFLTSLGTKKPRESIESVETEFTETDSHGRLVEQGERLFEDLGCLVCHRLTPPDEDDAFERLSLVGVSRKFQPGALRSFLLAPHARYRHSRMPDFGLSPAESLALESYLASRPTSSVNKPGAVEKPGAIGRIDLSEGDAARGALAFEKLGCAACHRLNEPARAVPARVPGSRTTPHAGPPLVALDPGSPTSCLGPSVEGREQGPRYRLSAEDRAAVGAFLRTGGDSLHQSDPGEAVERLGDRLQCAACHDRDGERSPRRLILAEEGSGRVPDLLPDLTWAGEKLQTAWVRRLLDGSLGHPTRPWLKARMPRFPAQAEILARGLARQHARTVDKLPAPERDLAKAEAGRLLASKGGLDCRQCHGVGDRLPRGDSQTQIALGINFADIRERLRPDYFQRFLSDPLRWDPATKMPKLSADGVTTKVRSVYDGDARRQFNALWQYIHQFDHLAEVKDYRSTTPGEDRDATRIHRPGRR